MTKQFPTQQAGVYYLTEGGFETEIMYKWGFEMPHFAMFPLLEKSDSANAIKGMYRHYLDVAAKYDLNALIGGFDYRASPDWGQKLGYSPSALHDANLGAIEFLRSVAQEYKTQISNCLFNGVIGPRGDAYLGGRRMSIAEAHDYHAVQINTLKKASVDLAWALTFNDPNEAIGVVLAAQEAELPVAVSFSLDSDHKLNTGVALNQAIMTVDQETNNAVEFFAVNCSHPIEFNPALEPGNWTERLRSIRPNAAKMDKISLCKLGHLEEGDPVELGDLMAEVGERFPQIDIWGGCCGTGHIHLEEIARRLPRSSLT